MKNSMNLLGQTSRRIDHQISKLERKESKTHLFQGISMLYTLYNRYSYSKCFLIIKLTYYQFFNESSILSSPHCHYLEHFPKFTNVHHIDKYFISQALTSPVESSHGSRPATAITKDSLETELQALINQAHSSLFPDNTKYKDSWLKHFEELLHKYAEVRTGLRTLQSKTIRQRPKLNLSKKIDENGNIDQVPSESNLMFHIELQDSFDQKVHGMIDDIENVCFSPNVRQLLTEFNKLKTNIDGIDEKSVKYFIKNANDEIKKYLEIIKEAADNFAYRSYDDKMMELEKKRLIFSVRIGESGERINQVNDLIDKELKDHIQPEFKKHESAVNSVKTAATAMTKLRDDFNKEIKTILGDANKPPGKQSEKQSSIKKKILETLQAKRNSFTKATNPQLYDLIEILIELYGSCTEMFEDLGKLVQPFYSTPSKFHPFKYFEKEINGKKFESPKRQTFELLENQREHLVETIRIEWFKQNQFCYGDDIITFVNALKDIKTDIKITEEAVSRIRRIKNDIPPNVRLIRNACSSYFVHDLGEHLKIVHDLLVFAQNEEESIELVADSLNKDIRYDIMKKASMLLIKTIDRPLQIVDYIVIAQKQLLVGIGPVFNVNIESPEDPSSPVKRSKSVLIRHKKSSGSANTDISIETETLNEKKFHDIINEKIEMISESNADKYPATLSILESIKSIIALNFDAFNRIRDIIVDFDRPQFQIDQIDIELRKNHVAKLPDGPTLGEIESIKKKLRNGFKEISVKLKPICVSKMHEKLLRTISKLQAYGSDLNEDLEITYLELSGDVQMKQSELLEKIDKNAFSKIVGEFSEMKTQINDVHSKRLDYFIAGADIGLIVQRMRESCDELTIIIAEANEMAESYEKLISPGINDFNSDLIQLSPPGSDDSADDATPVSPSKIAIPKTANKPVAIKPNDKPLFIKPGADKPIEYSDTEEEPPLRKYKSIPAIDSKFRTAEEKLEEKSQELSKNPVKLLPAIDLKVLEERKKATTDKQSVLNPPIKFEPSKKPTESGRKDPPNPLTIEPIGGSKSNPSPTKSNVGQESPSKSSTGSTQQLVSGGTGSVQAPGNVIRTMDVDDREAAAPNPPKKRGVKAKFCHCVADCSCQ